MEENKRYKSIGGIERRIDSLGRIVIPKEVRKSLNFKEGDLVSIKLYDNYVRIEKSESRCIFCNSTDELREYNTHKMCKKCIDSLIENFGE